MKHVSLQPSTHQCKGSSLSRIRQAGWSEPASRALPIISRGLKLKLRSLDRLVPGRENQPHLCLPQNNRKSHQTHLLNVSVPAASVGACSSDGISRRRGEELAGIGILIRDLTCTRHALAAGRHQHDERMRCEGAITYTTN